MQCASRLGNEEFLCEDQALAQLHCVREAASTSIQPREGDRIHRRRREVSEFSHSTVRTSHRDPRTASSHQKYVLLTVLLLSQCSPIERTPAHACARATAAAVYFIRNLSQGSSINHCCFEAAATVHR